MRRNVTTVLAAAAIFASAAIAASCNSEDTKTYDVTVTWNVAGANTCTASPAAGVTLEFDQITIELYDMEQISDGKVISGETPFQTETVADCALFSYTIQRLERGKYFALVKAWAMDDDSDHLPYYQAGTEIAAPSRASGGAYAVSLMLGKGEVDVTWGFDNYGQCSANGVTDIVISLIPSESIDCSLGQYLVTEVPWNDAYTLTVDGKNEDGDVTWTGAFADNPFAVKPGQKIPAQVILSPVAP
jgi:hypothetical protein